MKIVIWGFVLAIVILVGAVAFTAAIDYTDQKQVEEFIRSRGAAPVPMSWRNKIGERI